MHKHMANYRGVKLHEVTKDNSGNHVDLWPTVYTTLPWQDLTAQFHLQNSSTKCASNTRVKRQKRSSDRTENGKCSNVTNLRSRVGLVNPISHKWSDKRKVKWANREQQIYKYHKSSKSCRLVNPILRYQRDVHGLFISNRRWPAVAFELRPLQTQIRAF